MFDEQLRIIKRGAEELISEEALIEKLKEVFPKRWKNLVVVALAILENGQIDGYDGLDKQMNTSDIKKYTEILGIE